jgi:hypothetical protein
LKGSRRKGKNRFFHCFGLGDDEERRWRDPVSPGAHHLLSPKLERRKEKQIRLAAMCHVCNQSPSSSSLLSLPKENKEKQVPSFHQSKDKPQFTVYIKPHSFPHEVEKVTEQKWRKKHHYCPDSLVREKHHYYPEQTEKPIKKFKKNRLT